ncbi:ABC transporter ATP-binding protein [Candidatus Woesearchaeota archaeon]|jgi:ATP-binding cassette, subfamily B, bacterial|nr:ABC transporter ATP-binding protein [Candidatus Woesearchaeota archaeon]
MEHKTYSWTAFFQDYWKMLKGRRAKFFLFTGFSALSNLIVFANTFVLGLIIDYFTTYNLQTPKTEFYILIGILIFLGGFQVWLRLFGKIRIQAIGAEIRKEARLNALTNLMDNDLACHEKEETGSKIHKINDGGENIFDGIRTFSNQGLHIITRLVGCAVMFFALNIKYLAFATIFSIIYLAGETYYNKQLIICRDQLNKIKEKVSGKIHESTSNMLTVKSLGLKDILTKKATNLEKIYYTTWLKTRDVSQNKNKTIKIFSAITYGLFILMLGLDVMNQKITVGSIYVFASYFNHLKNGLHDYSNNINIFIKVKSAIGRFMTLFNNQTNNNNGKNNITKNWKTIEFKNITFKYKDKTVLKNFNLKINRNEKIGLVGKSGCGKSTLAKLLLQLYTPNKGTILIDNKNLNSFSKKSITNEFSIVLQDSEVFNLSLQENIAIATKNKNNKKLKESLQIAQLNKLISQLPKGINNLVGEKGYQVSGGERQRIGIARAIYKNTPLLILDEATSALDSKTESKIQKSLDKINNQTLLVIAHRLSTLKNTDKIIVLDKGKIVENGTFQQLIDNKQQFYQLHKIQNRN